MLVVACLSGVAVIGERSHTKGTCPGIFFLNKDVFFMVLLHEYNTVGS